MSAPFPMPHTHPQFPWQSPVGVPYVGYAIVPVRPGVQRLYIFSTRTGETYTRDCTTPARLPATILDFVRQHGLESPPEPVSARASSPSLAASDAVPAATSWPDVLEANERAFERAKKFNASLEKKRAYEPPVAADAPMRFEHGELPLHLLAFLRDRGPRSRLEMQQSAFGERPTRPQKARVTDAITALEQKGLIDKLGVRRHYRWRVSTLGRAKVRSIPSLPMP